MNTSRQPVVVRIITVLALVLLLAACGNPRTDLPGTWQEVNSSTRITFHEDGRLNLYANGVRVGGTYRFTDDTHIDIRYEGLAGGIMELAGPGLTVFEVSISGNRLRLTDTGGKVKEYQRVN